MRDPWRLAKAFDFSLDLDFFSYGKAKLEIRNWKLGAGCERCALEGGPYRWKKKEPG
jgi:hypothetical protein